MTKMTWQLYRTNEVGEWAVVADCESLPAAAQRIIQIEAIRETELTFKL